MRGDIKEPKQQPFGLLIYENKMWYLSLTDRMLTFHIVFSKMLKAWDFHQSWYPSYPNKLNWLCVSIWQLGYLVAKLMLMIFTLFICLCISLYLLKWQVLINAENITSHTFPHHKHVKATELWSGIQSLHYRLACHLKTQDEG